MDRKIAIKLLNDNYQRNVCLIENLTHDDVEFINVGNNAVCFKLIPSGLTMFSKIESGDILVDNLKNNWRCGMTTDADSAQFISSALGLKVKECIQVIYNKLPTIEIDGLNIEKLSCNEEIAKTIAKNYTLNYSVSAVYNLLKYRFMFGAYYNGELAGFIGMHEERSVGMLEVFDKFKRKGIGSALLSYAVNYFIENGYVPFGHIFIGNEKSILMHEKLRLDVNSQKVYWIE